MTEKLRYKKHMNLITLSATDLVITSFLVLSLSLITWTMGTGLGKRIIIAGLRTTVQLLLIGMVLKVLFAHANLLWVCFIAFVMLFIAGRETITRQKRRFIGWWGFAFGTSAMFVSSFTLTLFALKVIINVEPWYMPQYSIPLLGMMFGNTMNGISLSMDRLTQSAWQHMEIIEERLSLGQDWRQAVGDICSDSIRIGLIPVINAMAAAGIISLPGMMTGQILAGTPPVEAVKYQILIMFLLATGTGFGVIVAVRMGAKRLFDNRQRLRLDRLKSAAN